jgi:hypothetical protein
MLASKLFGRAGRIVLILTLVFVGGYDLAYLTIWFGSSPQPPFGDFFVFWLFGDFAAQAGAKIYDPVALQAFETLMDPVHSRFYPFWNAPTFLLVLTPLAKLPLVPAYLVWISATFIFYLRMTLGRDWLSPLGVAILVAPTTLINVISGQNGFLTAALLVGGLRKLRTSPALSGCLFGLLAYKPQFALMVPVVLLGTRNWCAIASACLTFVVSIAASSLAFGAAIWPRWIESIFVYGELLQANRDNLSHFMPTLVSGMWAINLPDGVTRVLTVVFLLAIGVLIWIVVTKGRGQSSTAAVIVASFLVAPYAFIYDMPMITSALVLQWRQRQMLSKPIAIWEIELVIVIYATMIVMVSKSLPFFLFAMLCALLWAMLRTDNSIFENNRIESARPIS